MNKKHGTMHSRQPPPSPTRKANAGGGMRECSRYSRFEDQLNPNHPLYQLANRIDWAGFDRDFLPLYCADNGRPAKPIRRMVGLLILKHLQNLSDESVVFQWEGECLLPILLRGSEFCGPSSPCEASELVHFRHWIGKEGMEIILQESIRIQGGDLDKDKEKDTINTLNHH